MNKRRVHGTYHHFNNDVNENGKAIWHFLFKVGQYCTVHTILWTGNITSQLCKSNKYIFSYNFKIYIAIWTISTCPIKLENLNNKRCSLTLYLCKYYFKSLSKSKTQLCNHKNVTFKFLTRTRTSTYVKNIWCWTFEFFLMKRNHTREGTMKHGFLIGSRQLIGQWALAFDRQASQFIGPTVIQLITVTLLHEILLLQARD